jgi:membrane protease YdiL (CAAX protease family)
MELSMKALQGRLLSKPDPKSHRLTKSIGILVGGTILSAWGIGLIPFEQLPLPGYWIGIIYRAFSGLVWLAAIWYFYPRAFSRFKITLSKRLPIGLLIVLFFTVGPIYHADYAHKSIFDVVVGFLFALGIGLDEDFFSRGLIFGAFESYGIQIAAIISAVHFGLLHFGNAIWGGQSFSFTSTQVVGAMAFGYLCVGLMLYTKTIWVPVLFHGLTDFPMQLESAATYKNVVTGQAYWLYTFSFAIPYVIIGWVLISLSRGGRFRRLASLTKRFGLSE